ncbi:hypothetical protein AUEXF2481DRAFT_640005 [Aureobasidium subglaciale EXF-2481]|uniref:Uncharacterized protein n=1 Tax=Aureobasidium subglaciale (strain EXF-2481) TaxID=1043005 RepID=A0A074ZCR1_AURSE|nr:uncharacterized protein AUEXF2481DRAFT_640005 [Aureobasidium subglaciale EXF-2481]KEQ96471.1 hypothetical protein AUEXF2481DRAFT_640005 [Aureobasidium subglaciale EXF-2481]
MRKREVLRNWEGGLGWMCPRRECYGYVKEESRCAKTLSTMRVVWYRVKSRMLLCYGKRSSQTPSLKKRSHQQDSARVCMCKEKQGYARIVVMRSGRMDVLLACSIEDGLVSQQRRQYLLVNPVLSSRGDGLRSLSSKDAHCSSRRRSCGWACHHQSLRLKSLACYHKRKC